MWRCIKAIQSLVTFLQESPTTPFLVKAQELHPEPPTSKRAKNLSGIIFIRWNVKDDFFLILKI